MLLLLNIKKLKEKHTMDDYLRLIASDRDTLAIFVEDLVDLFVNKEDAHHWFNDFQDAYYSAIAATDWEDEKD